MMADRWEMGSEFHWENTYITGERIEPAQTMDGSLFVSARTAVAALAESQGWGGRTIHLPDYFCPEVTESLANTFRISWYHDLPSEDAPHWDTLEVMSGDIVLAVNHFGVRSDSSWARWIEEHPGCIVIEDYSHDPSPLRMANSPAHYVLASLRKTLPLPDGGLVLSPNGLPLPMAPVPNGGSLKLEAMVLKALYLRDNNLDKSAFRALQLEGENSVGSGRNVAPSVFTSSVLGALDLVGQRRQRAANIRQLLKSDVMSHQAGYFQPLFVKWPEAATPFNGILRCRDRDVRNSLRNHLVEHQVYPAVHWVQEGPFASDNPASRELGDQLVTIPCDFRYGSRDIDRLLDILGSFRL